MAGKEKSAIAHWSHESVKKGLKLRFALGKYGYEFLRSTGYPTPSYSTLNRRVKNIPMDFGILHKLLYLLKTKVECLDSTDKSCALFIDEMEISSDRDFDTSSKSFVGNITLGSSKDAGKHYTVVLLRGLKSPWKQVIAHEVTGPSCSGADMKKFVSAAVEAAREIGLTVKATVSDMGSNNKAMWKAFRVSVSRHQRNTTYTIEKNADEIHSVADVSHLLKNMRNAMLSRTLTLPEDICKQENLPIAHVSAGYIKQLWILEIDSPHSLRSLHHLNKNHLFPTHFQTMNVALAAQLFSIKTAGALEKAVHLKQISKEALTTAFFIRLMNTWFSLMTARHRKMSITLKNQGAKFQFLETFIHIAQHMELGKGWKPLQTGMIMSSQSATNLAKELFSQGFVFFLPGRLSQDALENVFSQVRKKAGSKPTALKAKRALKLICLSQFISDLKNTSYASESDYPLLEELSKENEPPLPSKPLFSRDEPSPSASSGSLTSTSAAEENDIFYIAGSIKSAMLQKKLCPTCIKALSLAEDMNEPVVPRHRKFLNDYCNMGGLQEATSGIYRICRESERSLRIHKESLLRAEMQIDDAFVAAIKERCSSISMPSCCLFKEKIIQHYLVSRCNGIKNHLINKKALMATFGSASAAKKFQN